MRLILLSLLLPLLSCAMENSEASAHNVQSQVKIAYSELSSSLGFGANSYQFPSQLLKAEQLEKKYAQHLSVDFYQDLYRNEIIHLLGQAQAYLTMADQVFSSRIDSKLKNIPSEEKLRPMDMKALFESLSGERFAFGAVKSHFICVQQLSKRIRKKAGL